MNGIGQSHERLQEAWQKLRLCRAASLAQWNDPVSQHFEREYWLEFERVVPTTLKEMQSLADIIGQARRHVK